jgi:glycosyltransferase involved in cell wall biosynthesis
LIEDKFIPDDEAEIYFKAADVLVLPYRDIYQSGVLFTGQRFGIPVLAADVGSFGEDIVEAKTGFLFRPGDTSDLARTIERYFQSDLYKGLERHREDISACATVRHSWDSMSKASIEIYSRLLGRPSPEPKSV